MSSTNLLASAALFRALYDNNKDIYDVISEFVRAYILFNSKWTFNVSECVSGLKQTFEFELPEAVVSTCLRKRLKGGGELALEKGTYSVTDKFNKQNSIQLDYQSSKNDYSDIVNKLKDHLKRYSVRALDQQKIENAFKKYLLNEKLENEYSAHIAQFLIANQNDPEFKQKVNRIEEGLILYAGIKSTPDLAKLGSWRGNLLVFLDTEHLFSATGLNGELYKKIFDEFHGLVREVNGRRGKNGRITLKFFEETGNDVHSFFHAAEKIVEHGKSIDPSKTAMMSITNGCRWKSDVVEKKRKFEKDLERLGISLENNHEYYKNAEWNVESSDYLSKLSEIYPTENGDDKNAKTLKIFTKINVLRRGESKVPLDLVGAIFLTENSRIKHIAFSKDLYSNDGYIPYATDIEFLTERVWFRLNKGFGKDGELPTSFDVITKAKLVLSSQLNRSVSDTYRELNEKYEGGEIDKETVASLVADLRSRPNSPDDMSELAAEQSIGFIENDFMERAQREKALLELKAREGEAAISELKNIKYRLHKDFLKPLKRNARTLYFGLIFTSSIVLAIATFLIFNYLYGDNDTVLSVLLSVVPLFLTMFSFSKIDFMKKMLWRFCVSRYRVSLNKALRRTSR